MSPVHGKDQVVHFGDAVCRCKTNTEAWDIKARACWCAYAGVGWSTQQHHGVGRGILKKHFEGSNGNGALYAILYGSLGVR